MHTIVNPKQTRLFDPFSGILTDKTRMHLKVGWQGMFREAILELMPVEQTSEHYSSTQGRPSKELYSMAGLVLIKEFMNWTKEEALNAYRFHIDVQYALNLEPVAQDISMRTLERQIALFTEEEMAKTIMDRVTAKLVETLGVKIDQQRLDSTHIFSDMASFGRTRLMGVAIKRFLTHVRRKDEQGYNALDESLRQRYAPGVNQLFANVKKDNESRHLLRGQVAEDMYSLVKLFADNSSHNGKDTYKALDRIFYEQCEVHEDKVVVKKKTGGNVMQNTSDPDATYDGHKGQGYQVQIAETCNPENEVQLITVAIPQTAVESDTAALPKVIEKLKGSELLPQELLADTLYCSDENVQFAQGHGVELVGPTPSGSAESKNIDQLNVDDFDIDETTEEVVCCPAGNAPQSSVHDKQTGKTKTVMPHLACGQCEFVGECPVKKQGDSYVLDHTPKQRRLDGRRREEATPVFGERYQLRAGIEGTNSGTKRRTGLGRLRVRGRPAVFNAIYLKIAGWNILRAAACAKMREIIRKKAAAAVLCLDFVFLRLKMTTKSGRMGFKKQIWPDVRQFEEFSTLSKAA